MKKIREWFLLGGGALLAAMLGGGGQLVRGAVVVVLGVLGSVAVSRAGRLRLRWPRLKKLLGRRALAGVDERLEPALDAAEDALSAVAVEGIPFGAALEPVREGVIGLARRGLGLSMVRAGHEATLASIFLESQASGLELAARTELLRVNTELEQIRGVLATMGPSVRHLRLITNTEQLDSGEAPAELEARVSFLRDALTEELAHGAA